MKILISDVHFTSSLFSSIPCRSKSSWFGQPHPSSHPHLLELDQVTPLITQYEYNIRRRHFLNQLCPGSIALFPAAKHAIMTNDIFYPYRQNTNFSYLCGFEEPDSLLVLELNELQEQQTTLFLRPRILEREIWDGPRTGVDRAPAFLGVDQAYSITELDTILPDMLSKSRWHLWHDIPTDVKNLDHLLEPFPQSLMDPTLIVEKMRLIKSPSEQSLIRKSCGISAHSMVQTMIASRSCKSQQELDARMEFECRKRGSQRLAYKPVVASGIGCNTLHYIDNNRLIKYGELILLDAGGEYFNYASDITRTWPINGKFSEAQLKVYNAVLNVQKRCIEIAKPIVYMNNMKINMSLALMQQCAIKYFEKELDKIGINTRGENGINVMKLYPHMIGHFLGMDTHDVTSISYNEQLKPGMVITIEPGLYVPNQEIIPEELRGIGVRIEDDILITEGEAEVLTKEVPKEVEEIEKLLCSGYA